MKQVSQGKSYTKIKGRHAHRVVMECKLGRALETGEVVHHVDGNILNNNPENLMLLTSQAEHARLHNPEMLAKRKVKHGY